MARWLVRMAAVVACLAAGSALAHELKDPRVIVVLAGRSRVELRVNEMSSVPESEEIRRRFDGDRDGRLDDSEQSDLTSFLAIRATRNLSVEQNGGALPLVTQKRTLRSSGDRVDATDPLSVDVVLTAALAKAVPATLTMKDWRADDHAVRVAVLSSGVAFESASTGALDAKRGLVSGVELDRERALILRFRAP